MPSGGLAFPSCGARPLGFYPIVDRARWLERILALGVGTVQLRTKAPSGEERRREIGAAVALARESGARLFINDHWREAIELGAYGVHLGQEDLDSADLGAVAAAGLRLGISSHDDAEVRRALALAPSYLAYGPVFATASKAVGHPPQGLAPLRRLAARLTCPLVAIGGITLERAPAVLEAGAGGVAVIGALREAVDMEQAVRAWLRRCEGRRGGQRHRPAGSVLVQGWRSQ